MSRFAWPRADDDTLRAEPAADPQDARVVDDADAVDRTVAPPNPTASTGSTDAAAVSGAIAARRASSGDPQPAEAPVAATPAEAAALARTLQAVADPARVRILSLIATREPEPTTISELVDDLGLAQSTVSHHVRVLVDAGFLSLERAGTWSRYRAQPDALARLSSQLAPR